MIGIPLNMQHPGSLWDVICWKSKRSNGSWTSTCVEHTVCSRCLSVLVSLFMINQKNNLWLAGGQRQGLEHGGAPIPTLPCWMVGCVDPGFNMYPKTFCGHNVSHWMVYVIKYFEYKGPLNTCHVELHVTKISLPLVRHFLGGSWSEIGMLGLAT